jgi:hypothetical protein
MNRMARVFRAGVAAGMMAISVAVGPGPARGAQKPEPAQCASGRYVVKGRSVFRSDVANDADQLVLTIPGEAEGAQRQLGETLRGSRCRRRCRARAAARCLPKTGLSMIPRLPPSARVFPAVGCTTRRSRGTSMEIRR